MANDFGTFDIDKATEHLGITDFTMTFEEALEKLGVSEYRDRIFNSNSHGELMHLMDYVMLAQQDDMEWFKIWLPEIVEAVEETWDRPESIFQHIPRMMQEESKAQAGGAFTRMGMAMFAAHIAKNCKPDATPGTTH